MWKEKGRKSAWKESILQESEGDETATTAKAQSQAVAPASTKGGLARTGKTNASRGPCSLAGGYARGHKVVIEKSVS